MGGNCPGGNCPVTDKTAGHIPRDISKACTFVLLSGGTIKSRVTGRHENWRWDSITSKVHASS